MLYEETKISFILIGLAAIVEAVLLIYGLHADKLPVAVASIFIFSIVYILFFSMRVVIGDGVLQVSYGLGIISSTIPLEYIQRTEILPNRYLTWIYDPRREYVLQLFLRDGSRKIVGIGDPRRMTEILLSARRD